MITTLIKERRPPCDPGSHRTEVLSPINMDILRDVTEDDSEGLRQLTELYLKHVREALGQLVAAIRDGNAKSLETLAHGCRGSSAAFGAAPLSGLFHELEVMGRQGQLAGAASKLEESKREFGRVVSYLEEMFSQIKVA